ncbi:MAG: sulfite exporter TauE/SafE family protein [Lentisphaerota bacterium]
MDILPFSLLVFAGSIIAGFLGSLTGLGGGIVIVPLLTVVFGVDIRYAIGASLVSVIATSSGAASAYVKEGFSNMRIGMFLEVATTVGAIVGAAVALLMNSAVIAVIFGLVLLYSAYMSNRPKPVDMDDFVEDFLATKLKMNGSYPTPDGEKSYRVRRVPFGFAIMFIAGILSGLLGIGSGAVKVLAMDNVMSIPFKVSTATSNFMIGVTAAASAGIYLHEGYVTPGIAMPVMLGVLIGSTIGAKMLFGANTKKLRIIFTLVILALGLQMLYSGIKGTL